MLCLSYNFLYIPKLYKDRYTLIFTLTIHNHPQHFHPNMLYAMCLCVCVQRTICASFMLSVNCTNCDYHWHRQRYRLYIHTMLVIKFAPNQLYLIYVLHPIMSANFCFYLTNLNKHQNSIYIYMYS